MHHPENCFANFSLGKSGRFSEFKVSLGKTPGMPAHQKTVSDVKCCQPIFAVHLCHGQSRVPWDVYGSSLLLVGETTYVRELISKAQRVM